MAGSDASAGHKGESQYLGEAQFPRIKMQNSPFTQNPFILISMYSVSKIKQAKHTTPYVSASTTY